MVKVGINGFGRIGRLILRAILENYKNKKCSCLPGPCHPSDEFEVEKAFFFFFSHVTPCCSI